MRRDRQPATSRRGWGSDSGSDTRSAYGLWRRRRHRDQPQRGRSSAGNGGGHGRRRRRDLRIAIRPPQPLRHRNTGIPSPANHDEARRVGPQPRPREVAPRRTGLGALPNRASAETCRYRGGVVPPVAPPAPQSGCSRPEVITAEGIVPPVAPAAPRSSTTARTELGGNGSGHGRRRRRDLRTAIRPRQPLRHRKPAFTRPPHDEARRVGPQPRPREVAPRRMGLGALPNRAGAETCRYRGGVVPPVAPPAPQSGCSRPEVITAEALCRRWHLRLHNPAGTPPSAVIGEALRRRWHLPLRNPAGTPATRPRRYRGAPTWRRSRLRPGLGARRRAERPVPRRSGPAVSPYFTDRT
jgi:hypothetical protein